MICRTVLSCLSEDETAEVDWVEIDWPQTLRRALRLVSNAGTRIDVLLPPGGRLRHGDVLFESATDRIAVFLRTCDVLALRPASTKIAMLLSLRLGNQHLSVEVDGNTLFTPDDGPAQLLAASLNVPFFRQRRRFFPDVGV